MRIVSLLLVACRSGSDAELLVLDDRSELVGELVLANTRSAPGAPSDLVVLDHEGTVRWRRQLPGDVTRGRQGPTIDGEPTLYTLVLGDDGGPGSAQLETLGGRILHAWSIPDPHHDLLPLADGRVAWLEHVSAVRALAKDPEAPISADVVMAAFPGEEPEVLFDFFDDYTVQPWFVCSHMQKGQRIPGHYQWTHSNSLVQDPARPDELGVLSRNLDALVWFDIASGTVTAQLGGDFATLSLPGEDLDHPHMSHAPEPDHVLLFDNRLHERAPSRILEVVQDRSTGEAEVVWSFTHPEAFQVGFLGDARRLPGGHTLISWSDEARITEVEPGGDIVWELSLPGVHYVARVQRWDGPLQ